MTDEFTLRKATDRAAKARVLLDSDLFNEAFAELRQAYIDGWEATAARDQDARERFWTAITVLSRVRGHLETILTDGKIAIAELNEIDARRAREAAG
jgi:hypothetical protein